MTRLSNCAGQYILKHGVPSTDPFSYMSPSAEHAYTEHEWLVCILFFLLYTALGAAGLRLYVLGCVVLAGLLVGRTARLLGASHGALVVAGAFALLLILARTTARPHMVSLVFLAWYLWQLTRVEHGHRPLRTLWALVPAHWLWSQMHGGHMVGLALLGVGTVVEAAHWWQGQAPWKAVLCRAAIWLACVGVVVCGPYGVGMLLYPFREAALEHAIGWNLEWQGLWYAWPHPLGWGLTFGCMAALWWTEGRQWPAWLRWLGLAGWGLIVVPSSLGMLGVFPLHSVLPLLRGAALTLLCGEVLLWLGGAWRHPPRWHQAARVAVALGLAIAYKRGLFEVVPVVVVPMLAGTLTAVLVARGAAVTRAAERWLVGSGLIVLVVVSWLFTASVPAAYYGWGLAIPPALQCAADFLRDHGLQGRLWSTRGSAFAWLLWPRLQVNTDTRLHVYTPELLTLDREARHRPARVDEYLARFQPTLLAMNYRELAQAVVDTLLDRGWRAVHLNDRLFVLAAPEALHAGLRPYTPYIFPREHRPVTRDNAPEVLAEADRALAQCPAAATFALAYRAQALAQLGRHAEAKRAQAQIPKPSTFE
jgi:hypothetical protein